MEQARQDLYLRGRKVWAKMMPRLKRIRVKKSTPTPSHTHLQSGVMSALMSPDRVARLHAFSDAAARSLL